MYNRINIAVGNMDKVQYIYEMQLKRMDFSFGGSLPPRTGMWSFEINTSCPRGKGGSGESNILGQKILNKRHSQYKS